MLQFLSRHPLPEKRIKDIKGRIEKEKFSFSKNEKLEKLFAKIKANN
jgi:predicted Zn-dependent protease